MNKLLVLLFALLACDAKVGIGTPSEAQGQLSGGGLRVVAVRDGGLCSGLGTKTTPLNCVVSVDNDGGVFGTGSAGDPISVGDSFSLLIFGDASDGDATISSDNGIGRDVFYNDLTINSGVSLAANGYRVHVRGTLTLNGTIHANGGNGTAGTAGSSTVAACAQANGANACCNGFYPDSTNGGNGNVTGGAAGTETNSLFPTVSAAGGAAGSTGVGNDGADSAVAGRGGGGASGGGFVGTTSGAGGNGGGANALATDAFGGPIDVHDFLMDALVNHRPSQGTAWSGSGGGGGGGSCGKETVSTTQREPGGGGGGASGGTLVVLARRIVVGASGKLAARGGNGGNGGSCGTHAGDAGGGGGAGGGAGGTVFFMLGAGTMLDDSYFDVSGGIGGAAGTACAGGQNGGVGGDGAAGAIYKYRADGLM